MRHVRLAIALSLVVLGASTLQAQIAHSGRLDNCGCQTCDSCGGCSEVGCCEAGCSTCGGAACGCGTGGNACGALSGLTAKMSHALGGLLPGHVGSDARHQIYKAALHRSTFDKKCFLPLPYCQHFLSVYRHDRCCGSVSTECQTCQSHVPMGEEVISEQIISEEVLEIHEVDENAPMEPTPAVDEQARVLPGIEVPAQNAQHLRRFAPRPQTRPQAAPTNEQVDRVASAPAKHSKVISLPTLSSFSFLGSRDEPVDQAGQIRQVSAVRKRVELDAANPLR